MVAGHCSAAVVRWCRAGPGGGPGRLVAALPGRSVQIVTRAFVPAVIKFPLQCSIAHFTSGPEVYEYGLQVRCEVEGRHSWLPGDIIDNCGHFVDICHATR